MSTGSATCVVTPFRPCGVGLLLRFKLRALKNHFFQTVRKSPIKVLSALTAIALIWYGLEELFHRLLHDLNADTLQGMVAVPLMLDFFFVALMVMLAFSNGIISYSSLFARDEPAHLLTRPIAPHSVALLKFLESLLYSSWSLILVGLPLMIATARHNSSLVPWYYYPMFSLFFIFFIPIPGAIGLACAGAIGLWFSRIARRVFYIAVCVVSGACLWWLWSVWGLTRGDSSTWLDEFFDRAALIQGTFWPSRWVSTGLNHAHDGALADALFYLLLTFANALFLSWLAVKRVGRTLPVAYNRVQAAGQRGDCKSALTRLTAAALFWYLPSRLREIALKDLRTFLRDPMQWSQMLILLSLLGLYVINIPNIPMIRAEPFRSQLLVSFLNTAAISLLLATFTSRFVFPLISLETQQMWLMGLVPMPRGRLLIAKLAFALTVTILAAGAVLLLAAVVTHMQAELLAINAVVILAICMGLCGSAVGLGARFPMIEERNPAKIANGLGGTLNLIASIAMVASMLTICFFMGMRFREYGAVVIDQYTALLLAGLLAIGLAACFVPVSIGQRYFSRLEC